MFTKKQTALAVSAILGMSLNVAHAAPVTTTGNNFTMIDPGNNALGGTNDVTFTWDGTYNNNTATAVSNATLSSPTTFFGATWTAYDIKIYEPGTYALSTADTPGGAGCPFGSTSTGIPLTCVSGGNYNVTVGPNQVMGHMKFAWGASEGIDLVNVWNHQEKFGPSPIWAGVVLVNGTPIGPDVLPSLDGDPDQVWDGMSIDWDGDGKNGGGFIDGPFTSPPYSGNFNVMGLTPIPIPAAVWLFGSGLLGLLGLARRKKKP